MPGFEDSFESNPRIAGAVPSPDEPTHDASGVDITLIRAYLDMAPIERLRSLQNAVRTLQRFRPIETKSG